MKVAATDNNIMLPLGRSRSAEHSGADLHGQKMSTAEVIGQGEGLRFLADPG